MNRFSTRSLGPLLASTRRLPARTAAPLHTTALRYSSAGSGYGPEQPLPEEKASASSGGSRSKEAVETGKSPTAGVLPDTLAGGDARGRTGGGKPLSSSHHPPAQPKISNASVPGSKPDLTKEQQEEVDAHNKEFEAKHGRAAPAEDDKVNKSFWSGTGDRQIKGTGDRKVDEN
ncbi:hypothetical protein QBC42DRAFT_259728 [Cladorrhinum samala]|uniref:Succinate dehydrogenase assembly factor 4, mitochondrial n=1 Tax=Cladorrhinum samala TaxID=585594 RepID=A0AAV9HZT1_9PEZI|nr:hypothetical protein QBC42DRAFT_259728 [Cladorrhinum samala]